ncbi:MAG: YfiT family bacillithiol transferase [Acidobacteriota bacterium]
MTPLEKAIFIAVQAHAGAKDKAGEAYVLHPLRMMMKMSTETERVVAVLHDVVEDSDWTLEGLRREGFTEDVVDAVDHLTRRPGEDYEDFVRRAVVNPVALRVKIADLEDNLNQSRLKEPITDEDRARMVRYRKALAYVRAQIGQKEGGLMLDRKQRESSISQIERLPADLEKLVRDLGEQELESRYRDGSWTVRQLVHHLADAHTNAYVRMKLTLTEDRPTVKPYDQDEWSKLEDARTLPLSSSLDIIRGVHHRWSVLMRSLPEEAWSRRLFHPERGELTLEDLLESCRAHGESHLEQIRAALGR